MSNTPRTDSVMPESTNWHFPDSDEYTAQRKEMQKLERELAEAQTTLQFAKKEYHALFREFSILVKQRDKLAKICARIEQAYLEGSDSEWGNALMDIRLALAAIKGYEV